MHKDNYIDLIKQVGLSLIFFILMRLVFLFYNFDYFSSFSVTSIIYAFVIGLRFDLATCLITNLPFILFSLLPYRSNIYNKLLKTVFIIFNSIVLYLLIIDLEFFNFIGKKFTADIFGMSSDIQGQAFQILQNYWKIQLFFLFMIYTLYKLYPKTSVAYKAWRMKLYRSIPISFALLVLTLIGIRGGIQMRSLSPKSAFVHEHFELGNLSLNAAYTLFRSIGKKQIESHHFFKSKDEAIKSIKNYSTYKSDYVGEAKSNVVLIIMESFSYEYFVNGYMPFLKTLSKKSLSFERGYANGRRSIEALPSILAGFPSLMKKPLYQSQYQNNKYFPLPQALLGNHYSTHFFHGGKKGTMDFDTYCSSVGIENYYGLSDYPNESHYDGHWGVYDHYYFSYVVDKLSDVKSPFLATIFSLSSHQPYSIPEKYKGKFPKGKLPIHESIGYADESLRQFFDKAKGMPWYKNTLFVITADHTQKVESSEFKTSIGRYRVPILYFYPEKVLPRNREFSQHADILPSILDFLEIDHKNKLLFGNSVFSNKKSFVFNHISDNYILFDGATTYQSMASKLKDISESDGLSSLMKALIQYTNSGLKNNNIYEMQQ